MNAQRIPRTYVAPFVGVPAGPAHYWMQEQSGVLKAAILTYLDHRLGKGPEPSAQQIGLIADYCDYWIKAPCWCDPDDDGVLEQLREEAGNLKSSDEVSSWLHRAMDLGVDPL